MRWTRLAALSVVLAVFLAGISASAQVGGQGTGLQPMGVVCRNLTTGQQVTSTTALSAWDCGSLGLETSVGDRVETGLRGSVPVAQRGAGLDLRASSVPEDFAVHLVSALGTSRVIPGDLDDDGDVDVLAQDPFRWHENLGGDPPLFVDHPLDQLIPGDNGLRQGELVDVNGDGRLDIVGTHVLGGGFDRLSWFRNDGGSPLDFTRKEVLAEDLWDVISARAADVDGDGDTDFYASRRQVQCSPCLVEIIWAENVPHAYVSHLIAPKVADFMATVDMDLDGDPDVVAGAFGGEVNWFENEGGTFPTEHPVTSGEGLQRLTAADIDGDGDPDVALATFDDTATWFENLGDGSFAEHFLHDFGGFSTSRSITVADVTGDGLPDIVLGHEEAVWLENQGGSPPSFSVHTVPVSSTAVHISPEVADIDDDGRLDLVADGSPNVVEWYKNQIGRRLSVTGLRVRGFTCRNMTTGQKVRLQTTDTAIDCDNEGLIVNPGDEIALFATGQVE